MKNRASKMPYYEVAASWMDYKLNSDWKYCVDILSIETGFGLVRLIMSYGSRQSAHIFAFSSKRSELQLVCVEYQNELGLSNP